MCERTVALPAAVIGPSEPCREWASDARRRFNAAGFRMPLAEPGVRLALRTGLSLDVYA
jgi:hypothetical protein